MSIKWWRNVFAVVCACLAGKSPPASCYGATSPLPAAKTTASASELAPEIRPTQAPAFQQVNVDEFARMMEAPETVVLDVRTAREFKAGHIKNAINLDFYAADFAQQLAGLDKSKTYLVHCASGVRSVKACKKMSQLNFAKLYNLTPGFLGWQRAGKPVER